MLYCQKNLLKVIVLLLLFRILLNSGSAFAQSNEGNFFEDSSSPVCPRTETFQPTPTPFSEYEVEYKKKIIGLFTNLHLINCILIGERCQKKDPAQTKSDISLPENIKQLEPYYKNGVLGVVQNLIAVPYAYPPSSFGYVFIQTLNKLSPVKTAYAQVGGLGFNSLAAFASFWSVNRNIAYSLIIFILVVTGFLLIFRYKIDPNTSIDLEKVFMKTFLVILAITFSYAIAGLIIDLAYLLLFIIFNIAKQNTLAGASEIEKLYGQTNFGDFFHYLLNQGNPHQLADNFYNILPKDFQIAIKSILKPILALQMYPLIATAARSIATIFETSVGGSFLVSVSTEFDPGAFFASIAAFPISVVFATALAGWLIKLCILISVLIALLFLYFKILFLLIGSYVEVVFSVLFSPFILLVDIFPGKNQFVFWIKHLTANMLTFPLLAFLLLAGANITQIIANSTDSFLPPPLAGLNQSILASLIGIGILISIPQIINRIKRWITPEYTLVNFPSTPGAMLGTIATLIPFIPFVSSLPSSLGALRMFKKKPGNIAPDKTSLQSHQPHMPHMPQASNTSDQQS